jgi:vancomycin resistance protein YoaR
LAAPEVEAAFSARVAGHGLAPLAGLDDASRINIQLAIDLLDGTVVEPGAQLSFDDVARTWDFREDPRYVWGWGTSSYGLIHMRGGGVCWVSTALWRAALVGGLETDLRANHYGLVRLLGAGTDATNTLVLRNNSSEPITVRAWVDDENVNVALFHEGNLGRSAQIRGPERLGPGRYALYQDVTWADGTVTTSPFYSGYFW